MKRNLALFIFLLLLLIVAAVVVVVVIFTRNSDELQLKLRNGSIRGRRALSIKGRTYYSFQSIPYAAPPVGPLRFKPPVPPNNWHGVRDATYFNVTCYQVPFDLDSESEDCLYLNVYTPQLPKGNSHLRLPVMLYIYGGGFVQGDCLEYHTGPQFLMDHDVIVITINYRVGPFGFLSTGDLIIPGNNGLKDQQMAIRWTYDNINIFGGDPQKITIFGQSAGSASVTYQLLNQKNQGLFRGGILQSGTFLSPWSFQRHAREIAFATAALINDTFNELRDSQALLEFLQMVPAKDLDAASANFSLRESLESRQIAQGFFYAPVIEPEHPEAFLTHKMYVRIKNGDIIKVPILIGITSEEAIAFMAYPEVFAQILQIFDGEPQWLVPQGMNIEELDTQISYGNRIRNLYTGGTPFVGNWGAGIRYFSDHSFTRSIIKFGELYSQFTDVYFYQFSYDGMIGNFSVPAIAGAGTVVHTEELQYIWNRQEGTYNNSDLSIFPPADQITQRRIQEIWTNFAKFLNPTPFSSDLLNITWPKVSFYDSHTYLYVDIDEDLTIRNFPKEYTFLGWNDIYESLGNDDFDTW